MNKAKNNLLIGLIYAIIFGVFNLLVFVIFKERNNVFWTSYVFVTLAFMVQIISMLIAFKNREIESVFMGIPLASLSFFYFFAAVFAGIVFMIFRAAPFALAFILQLLILAAYAIVAILSVLARDAAQGSLENVRSNVQAVQRLTVDVNQYLPRIQDPTLKRAVMKVSDTIRYSDPMSTPAVANYDNQIRNAVAGLGNFIMNNNIPAALQTCKDIEVLYLQRNGILKSSK